MIDRTPNPFGKSRTEPNRTFGKTWVPPKRFSLWAERVRPRGRTCSAFREEPKGGEATVVPYYLQHTLRVILAFRPAPPPGEGWGGPADLPPSPILPRLPSSLSPCLDSRPFRPREKTPLSEVCSPFGRSRPRPSRVRGSWPTDNYLGT